METTVPIFGYQVCSCGTPMLNEVAWKTGGRCADCYRAEYNKILEPVVLRIDGQKVPVKPLASDRRPGERAQRKRARKARNAQADQQARNRTLMLAHSRAKTRLQNIFPEIYELLLADERAKLGMEAWTLDAALTPFLAQSTLEWLKTYHRL